MIRLHAVATIAVACAVSALAACGGGAFETNALPHEGTWRLVRVNGQALPARIDTIEIQSEDVRFIFTGSGFVRQVLRRFETGAAGAGVNALCESWFGYAVDGTQISTVPAAEQGPMGVCPPQLVRRAYTLDGDTLRSNGGTGFTFGAVSHAYIRVSRD